MHNRVRVSATGAAILVLLTWPVWRAVAFAPGAAPQLAKPTRASACVAPTAYMRASHMKLLIAWRERVVRDGVRTYTGARGEVVKMSLTGTCLGDCHTDRAAFCDRCHDYAGVAPNCWNCHNTPEHPASDADAPSERDVRRRAMP